jgi:hypothetical protein
VRFNFVLMLLNQEEQERASCGTSTKLNGDRLYMQEARIQLRCGKGKFSRFSVYRAEIQII